MGGVALDIFGVLGRILEEEMRRWMDVHVVLLSSVIGRPSR
jgi:hypothetical protein